MVHYYIYFCIITYPIFIVFHFFNTPPEIRFTYSWYARILLWLAFWYILCPIFCLMAIYEIIKRGWTSKRDENGAP